MRLWVGLVLWSAVSGFAYADTDLSTETSLSGDTELLIPSQTPPAFEEHDSNEGRKLSLEEQKKKDIFDKQFADIYAELVEYQNAVDMEDEKRVLSIKGSILDTRRDLTRYLPETLQQPVRRIRGTIVSFLKWTGHYSRYSRKVRTPPERIQEAIAQLSGLADRGHQDSMLLRAEMDMYGRYGAPMDLASAFTRYQKMAESSGNATAQYMVGFFYSTGIGGVPQQNSLALLYTTMAAIQEYGPAEMVVGFRSIMGLGTAETCSGAVANYQSAARRSIGHFLSGPPLGRAMPKYRVRLSDEMGSAYGVQTGPNSIHRSIGREAFGELIEYYRFSAQKGNFKASLALADLYYSGHQFLERNLTVTSRHVRRVLSQLFTQEGKLRSDAGQAEVNVAGHAAGLYGLMLLRGEGVPVDTSLALKWLRIGTELGHGAAINALGYMHQHGIEVDPSAEDAIELYKRAADRGHSGGHVNYALAVSSTMPKAAVNSLNRAARSGHVLAHFNLGEMHARVAETSEVQCRLAVASYRFVVENADWQHSPFAQGIAAFRRGDLAGAALHYMRAAEMGYGVGQLNAAVLLEHAARADYQGDPRLAEIYETRGQLDRQAGVYWTRAANQNIADARVKQGDHYYHGRGTECNPTRAAAAYRIAAESERNGLAMWNLGYMFENGIGVERDFHLAKRYYDLAVETNENGRLAGYVSLVRLCAKYLWAWVRGEDVGDAPLFFAPRLVNTAKMAAGSGSNGGPKNDDMNDVADEGNGYAHQQGVHGVDELQADEWGLGADILNGDDDHARGGAGDDGDGDGDDEEGDLGAGIFFVVVVLAIGWFAIQPR
ncbi:ERAD-associated protein [Coemansia interrupta]|uniref:ERAD-associated protein n=1 Tax=Coemansia interrupta TaxID=1126814 RepID=A0A9W8LHT4_9FUNG|nr:ERAD-associated protein [Coemansia interrupta]